MLQQRRGRARLARRYQYPNLQQLRMSPLLWKVYHHKRVDHQWSCARLETSCRCYFDSSCGPSPRIQELFEGSGQTSTPLYEARSISKKYGSVVALDQANFHINAGEIIGLVGDNGAGKSTLVKCLSGAHQPTSGQMFVDGREVQWNSPHEAIEAGIETLYPDSGLAPHLTVGANVFLGREKYQKGLLGKFGFLDNMAMNKEAHEDLERVGIAVPASTRARIDGEAEASRS